MGYTTERKSSVVKEVTCLVGNLIPIILRKDPKEKRFYSV
jgi:hypothetical protein